MLAVCQPLRIIRFIELIYRLSTRFPLKTLFLVCVASIDAKGIADVDVLAAASPTSTSPPPVVVESPPPVVVESPPPPPTSSPAAQRQQRQRASSFFETVQELRRRCYAGSSRSFASPIERGGDDDVNCVNYVNSVCPREALGAQL